jgi:hypothetical protein
MEVVMLTKPASFMVQDGGPSEPRTVDFPFAEELLPVQALSGGVVAAFRPMDHVGLRRRSWDPEGLICIFIFVLVFSVRNLV